MRAIVDRGSDFSTFARCRNGGEPIRLSIQIGMLALAVTGCLADEPDVSQTSQAATVSTYVSSSCSTAVVLGLSKQIADEIACSNSALLRRFQPTTKLQITSNAVLPYLAANAKTALENVAATRTVQVNSAFRTVAQQYLLYRWNIAGRCGITAAASPGRSNHESGRALDVQNYSSVISAMAAKGWSHSVPGDPVHFDHLGSPDSRGQDVRAFQRLWNRNHPSDKIAEDGAYGPATESRLRQAPATGFALGPSCGSTGFVADADVVAVDGPDRVQPLVRTRYTLTLQNNGAVEWPATTMLRLATAATSPLYDATWLTQTELAQLGSAIAPGASGTLSFDVSTPNVAEETPIFEELVLADGARTLGSVSLALTVVPGMAEPTSGDSDDENDYDQEISGGCSTGNTGSTSALFVLMLLGLCKGYRRLEHPGSSRSQRMRRACT